MKSIAVVAAVIADERGRILLTRRPQGSHMAGLWEFPGGKVEDDETNSEALVRELREELGIEVETGPLLDRAVHTEPGLEIRLSFFTVSIVRGEPIALEGQETRWVGPDDMSRLPMPPADEEFVRSLRGR